MAILILLVCALAVAAVRRSPLSLHVAGFGAILLVAVGVGCSPIQKIPARGVLHGYPIETTVDSPAARYYLESYLPGEVTDDSLHQRIDSVHDQIGEGVPTREQLRQLSADFSVDFAALVFGDQLLKQPGNPQLQQDFLANLARVQDGTVEYLRKDTLIVFVPGFDYAENGPVTGADFAKPRRLLEDEGYDVHFVDVDPVGSVEENAAYLAQTLRRYPDRPLVIVGASSAGPAIHLALGGLLSPPEVEGVQAWLNLGGILQGVPVLDAFASGPRGAFFSTILWLEGWERDSFESMSTGVSRRRFAGLAVPAHVRVYNYVGLSLSGDISSFAQDKYRMMREQGPNDGLTLLPDIIAPNSLSILSPSTDHFFAEDPRIDDKTMALLATIMERLPEEADSAPSASAAPEAGWLQ